MKRVLFIEDDQVVAMIYRNKFGQEGFEAECAGDGETGIQMMNTFKPDVIVLDLMLPRLHGIEVIKQARALPLFAKTPIIVLTNTFLTNTIQDARQAGATKCLSKASCTPRQLLDTVRASLENPQPEIEQMPMASVETPAAPEVVSSDEEFQARLRRDLIGSLPMTLKQLRDGIMLLNRARDEASRVQQLQGVYNLIHPLTGNAGLAGLVHIAQMADAFEALLKELIEKPKNLNPSTMRTVASAADFMGFLFQFGLQNSRQAIAPRILVVDDEAISRRAVMYALEKARLQAESCEDPFKALEMIHERQFDLVFLDVDMPGMNGYELCSKIRTQPQHKGTTVVFVTSLNDLESRANSTMSGGSDFIGKPFLFVELAVKALMHLLRARLKAK